MGTKKTDGSVERKGKTEKERKLEKSHGKGKRGKR